MDINIIKSQINNNLLVTCILSFSLFYSCYSQKGIIKKEENKCKVFEMNLNRVPFSENKNDLSNLELNHFYDDNHQYDVLFYSHLEGSNDYKLQRYYKNNLNIWKQIIIENGSRSEKIINFDKIDIKNLFSTVAKKAYFQYCGNCFDCKYYTFLIKKNKTIFKYYSNAEVFTNLDSVVRQKLINYINIYELLF